MYYIALDNIFYISNIKMTYLNFGLLKHDVVMFGDKL